MPSASPWALLAQPMMNATAAEAALGRTLADVHHTFDALRNLSRDLVLASQQTQGATLTQTPSDQTINKAPVEVSLQNAHIQGKGQVTVGYLSIDNRYVGDPKYAPQLKYKMWLGQEPKDYVSGVGKMELTEVGHDATHHIYAIKVLTSFFKGYEGKSVNLDVRFDVVQKDKGIVVATGSGRAQYAIGHVSSHETQPGTAAQSADGDPSVTSTTQEDRVNVGNHPASVAEMSARDQFFVALAQKNHPDGLPIITAGNWGG